MTKIGKNHAKQGKVKIKFGSQESGHFVVARE